MKKWFVLLFLLVLLGSGYQKLKNYSYSFCDQPIKYKIGTVDPKFNLSKDEFLSDTKKAAQIWSGVIGKPLFINDPEADLTISLIYDERQSLNTRIRSLESELKENKSNLDPQIAQFEAEQTEFKKRVADLNAQIEYWNSKGGAPKDKYEELLKAQQELKAQAQSLNEKAQVLNQSTSSYNQEVGQLNNTIDQFNESISERPEEGLYDPASNTISIYFNISTNELIHTLAHELGHARGLDHNQNKQSIMYPYTTKALVPSPEDKSAMEQICKRYSVLELAQAYLQRFKLNLKLILSSYVKI